MKRKVFGFFGLILVAFLATGCLGNLQPCPPGTHTSLWSSSCESDQPEPDPVQDRSSGSKKITFKLGDLSLAQKFLLAPILGTIGLIAVGIGACGIVSASGNNPFETLRGSEAAFAICFIALAVLGICFFIAK